MSTLRTHRRRAVLGSFIGTTIEWYDFYLYGLAAALVFNVQFFPGQTAFGATLASFATLAVGVVLRPLGGIVAGHFGDRVGRKALLVISLLLMGGASMLIGVLPTFAQAGWWAVAGLVLLRCLQGLSAGMEWGGAALMSVEHAPRGKRGLFGAYPQIGVPLGMILATGVLFIVRSTMSEEQFLTWGWRIPFLISVVLIVVGYLIRKAVEESPVFKEMQQLKVDESAPLGELFRHHTKEVILAAVIFAANNGVGYLLIAWFSKYGGPKGLGMTSSEVLIASLVGGVGWFIFTLLGGWVSDKIGRKLTFVLGYGFLIVWAFPLFGLLNTASLPLFSLGLFILTLGLGPSYGPQSAMYAEMFPARVRFSGVSIGYALGTIIGGAFAPLIADQLVKTGWENVAWYIIAISAVSLIAVLFVPKGIQDRELHDEQVVATRSNPVVPA